MEESVLISGVLIQGTLRTEESVLISGVLISEILSLKGIKCGNWDTRCQLSLERKCSVKVQQLAPGGSFTELSG